VISTAHGHDWVQKAFLALIIVIAIYLALVPAVQAAFGFRKKITIDNAKVSGTSDLLNFPLLIKIENDNDLKTTVNGGQVTSTNGYDIVFRAADEVTQLDHEIESYDGTTGTLTAWIKIPVLDHNDDTVIYLYYGDSSISSSQENATGVWTNNYIAVWHLNETTITNGTEISESSASNLPSTSINGATSATGVSDGSFAINGSNIFL